MLGVFGHTISLLALWRDGRRGQAKRDREARAGGRTVSMETVRAPMWRGAGGRIVPVESKSTGLRGSEGPSRQSRASGGRCGGPAQEVSPRMSAPHKKPTTSARVMTGQGTPPMERAREGRGAGLGGRGQGGNRYRREGRRPGARRRVEHQTARRVICVTVQSA
jgi:hypothetical protein